MPLPWRFAAAIAAISAELFQHLHEFFSDCLSRLFAPFDLNLIPCTCDLRLLYLRSYSISEILKAQHRHPLTLLPLNSLRFPEGTAPRLFPPEDVSCSALAILRLSACSGSFFDGRDVVGLWVEGHLGGAGCDRDIRLIF